MTSGGSLMSWSVTADAITTSAQLSLKTKSVAGFSVNVVGPPDRTAAWLPLSVQVSVNDEAVTFTGSLKVTARSVFSGTAAAALAGLMEATVGASSVVVPHVAVCDPRLVKVLVKNPSHWARSKASEPSGSPAQTLAIRFSVLSPVLALPVPHSMPGSNPIWPITSTISVPRRRTTASSPLNHPALLVWSARATMSGAAPACAIT